MSSISRITLTNYKSFRELDFELRPLNILIGRNGTGKSNLIGFLRMLRDAADGHLADNIRAAGGLKQIRWRGNKEDERIEWKLKFEKLKNNDDPTCFFEGHLAAQANGYTIQLEEISRPPYPKYTNPFKFLSAADGYPRILKSKAMNASEDNLDEGNGYSYNAQEFVISQLRDPVQYPLLNEIRSLLADWIIFRGFGESALKNIYDSQPLDVILPLRLDIEGKKLVSVLHAVANDSRYNTAQDQLEETLSAGFPEFRKLAFITTAKGTVELQWRNKNGWQFAASEISDGMLRFLGLATLLLLPEPPSLIAIDEPEVGLHPRLLPLLADLLKDASTRTQIIVTTHAPELLNAEVIEPEDIVVVERENDETHVERLNTTQLELWLDRYTLGGLWTMGKLERQAQ